MTGAHHSGDQFGLLRETDVAAFRRKEHARLEDEGALLEFKERELARQERRLGLRRTRASSRPWPPTEGVCVMTSGQAP
jgi:hypothetical protein